jgi:hypothetical protein
MKMKHTGPGDGAVPALVLSVMLLGGCSIAVLPHTVPSPPGAREASLSGVSLAIANAEKDASERSIPTDTGGASGLKGNREAWSRKLVEALARELAMRGARVSSTAPLTLSVALPEIAAVQTGESFRITVKAAVLSSTGWSKNYEGIGGPGTARAWSISAEADKLAGQALAAAVKAMLDDTEFLAQLSAAKEEKKGDKK